jgi:hypothetical protein
MIMVMACLVVMSGVAGCSAGAQGEQKSTGVTQPSVTPTPAVPAPLKPVQAPDAKITADGWGLVRMGSSQSDVEALLGQADSQREFPAMDGEPAVVFHNYLLKGIQISYVEPDMTVNALFFYSGDGDHSEYTRFDGAVEKGLSWTSSAEDVLAAYGKPKNDYKGDEGGEWRRLVYANLSFRFENEHLETVAVGAD